jgi:hypothetical protein
MHPRNLLEPADALDEPPDDELDGLDELLHAAANSATTVNPMAALAVPLTDTS